MRPLPAGLYAITPTIPPGTAAESAAFIRLEAVLAAGVALLQYRDKQADPAERLRRAGHVQALCRRYSVPLIINDDLELACTLNADGLHIGRDDGAVADARARLAPTQWLGVTCGDNLGRAHAAVAAGANYVAFGRLFPSRTKPDAPPARLETVTIAARTLPVPVCAIGGILPEHLPTVRATGAHLIAVIDGVFGASDPAEAVHRYRAGLPPYNDGSDLPRPSDCP